MKKIVALAFLLVFVFTSFAGNGKPENPKAINYKEILKKIEYPQCDREKGIEGKVIVLLQISKTGKIKNYKFKSSPSKEMQKAVEAAIPGMVFKPATNEEGEAVDGIFTLPVNFKLTI